MRANCVSRWKKYETTLTDNSILHASQLRKPLEKNETTLTEDSILHASQLRKPLEKRGLRTVFPISRV